MCGSWRYNTPNAKRKDFQELGQRRSLNQLCSLSVTIHLLNIDRGWHEKAHGPDQGTSEEFQSNNNQLEF